MKVGKWNIPTELFEQYVIMISSTERSSDRYSYEFDKMRTIVHNQIVNYLGLLPHTREYAEFERALRDSCEKMLPERFQPQQITKINPPCRGITNDTN